MWLQVDDTLDASNPIAELPEMVKAESDVCHETNGVGEKHSPECQLQENRLVKGNMGHFHYLPILNGNQCI